MSAQPATLDLQTLRRFFRAVRDLLTSEVRRRAIALLILLLAFALSVNGLNVVNSYVGRDFMTAIEHRDMAGFVRLAILYVGVFAATTAVAVLYRFTEERLEGLDTPPPPPPANPEPGRNRNGRRPVRTCRSDCIFIIKRLAPALERAADLSTFPRMACQFCQYPPPVRRGYPGLHPAPAEEAIERDRLDAGFPGRFPISEPTGRDLESGPCPPGRRPRGIPRGRSAAARTRVRGRHDCPRRKGGARGGRQARPGHPDS